MIFFKPEKRSIPGLKEKARKLSAQMGGITRQEILAAVIIFLCIGIMSVKQFIPQLKPLDKNGIILVSTVLFFVFKILNILGI